MHNLLPSGGEVYYYPRLAPEDVCDGWFTYLEQQVPWRQEYITIFGKRIAQPRLTSWHSGEGLAYAYSGLQLTPLPWNGALVEILAAVRGITGLSFNSALLNYYRSGADSIGWHRDNEKGLGPQPVIASVSLGAPRKFQLRNYVDKTQLVDLTLEPGSLVVMMGDTQRNWEHRVPRSRSHAGRINITFRNVIPQ